jgi:hypothetical protein
MTEMAYFKTITIYLPGFLSAVLLGLYALGGLSWPLWTAFLPLVAIVLVIGWALLLKVWERFIKPDLESETNKS